MMLVDRLRNAPSAAQHILHAMLPSGVADWANHDYDALIIRTVDLRNCTDKSAVLEAFGSALRFPAYFAGNWDSFEECLADVDTPDGGMVLLVLWFSNLAAPSENDACTLFAVIRDVAVEWDEGGRRRLSVILVGDVPAEVEKCIERNQLSLEEFTPS